MSSPSAASPPQPRWITPRSPARRGAAPICALSRRASGTVALPSLTNTGGGPGSRNFRSLSGSWALPSYGNR
ncbi:hypothetical protein [Streptomyces sp. NPDC001435]|uniref:hypothetical protein n=1 Tax=Streptomyces sp. NPDC001435 TaxID=3364576 RepID=UPI0036B32FA8